MTAGPAPGPCTTSGRRGVAVGRDLDEVVRASKKPEGRRRRHSLDAGPEPAPPASGLDLNDIAKPPPGRRRLVGPACPRIIVGLERRGDLAGGRTAHMLRDEALDVRLGTLRREAGRATQDEPLPGHVLAREVVARVRLRVSRPDGRSHGHAERDAPLDLAEDVRHRSRDDASHRPDPVAGGDEFLEGPQDWQASADGRLVAEVRPPAVAEVPKPVRAVECARAGELARRHHVDPGREQALILRRHLGAARQVDEDEWRHATSMRAERLGEGRPVGRRTDGEDVRQRLRSEARGAHRGAMRRASADEAQRVPPRSPLEAGELCEQRRANMPDASDEHIEARPGRQGRESGKRRPGDGGGRVREEVGHAMHGSVARAGTGG